MPLPALPTQHVPRARLVDALGAAQIGLIEAGGGYGKSVLAAELRAELGIASAAVVLERDTAEAGELVGAIRRGLRAAGLSDVAAALAGPSAEELAAALDQAAEPVLLVVDEAQHASGEAAALLADLARELRGGHRLLLVGRRLEPALLALAARDDVVHLDAGALAFDGGELRALVAAVLEREPGNDELAEIDRLAAGWPAASALAASRLARAPTGARGAIEATRPLASLLEALLAGVDASSRERIGVLAHLPQLSETVAAACAGPGSLELLVDAGLPVRSARPGWAELPDPIREELADGVPLPQRAGRDAAAAYADAGELPTGLTLLAEAGDPDGVAELVAGRRWQELARLDLAELRAILTSLPPPALAAHPFCRVQVARLAERDADLELRTELLEGALADAAEEKPRREIEAELTAARAMTEPGGQVEADAATLLEAAAGDETRVRARALQALARIEAWRGDPASMLSAEKRLAEAAALCRLAGEVEWEAWTLNWLGYRVAFARGDLEQAIERMGEALALLPGAGRERAAVATFLAEALAYVGRLDDAEATLGEAAAIGRRLADHRVQAYAAWTGTTLASLRGDAAATRQRVRTVELHPGDWFDHPTGIEFLADAALALARTGAREPAKEYAQRARERAEASGFPEIAWLATGAVAARWGDAEAAEESLLAFLVSPQQAPRDEWRTLLLRALAAQRRGDDAAGELAARAYESAGELGLPGLPALHEPDVAEAVAPLAVASGSRAATAASEPAHAFAITVLGDFGVSAGGRPAAPPAGRPATLVKLLALADCPIAADEAIEALWPEVDAGTGRQRLRNLLNRLRKSCGDLVERDGDALVLAEGTEVDARRFDRAAAAAGEAHEEARPGLARTAVARYGGELLPADRYEPWATAPRERLRRRYLELLDLLADDAVGRGDVDEAIRLLDRAQAAEPLDEERYLRAAELLLFQGRRGSARALVERAGAVLEELGLEESERLARLRVAVGTN